MDTSTLSFTDATDDAPVTSRPWDSAIKPPGAEWFTRLISPLTSGHRSAPAPAAASAIPTSYFQPLDKMDPPSIDLSEGLEGEDGGGGISTVLLVFIPVMAVVFTVLLGMVVFLVAMLYMRRKRGIRLTEDGGPLDLSKTDGVMGEGGIDGVESRWLETVDPDVRTGYRRAKDYQNHYPPASVPTDITLSQFLSIQEKGVSAWSFEPDYEENLSLYVQSRTEITFMSDGPGMPAREGGGNNVMANLPLPKLNEVYYWEVKMYEKPPTTEVAIGLATKPYPSFRLPGWNRISVAYFASDGFKSHNYPFAAASHGPPLAEGDVLGVGYRPRTGTVFFTRNGRKMDDAYTGLQRFNLFPTIGANGPCTVHVNLGQAGFVFIEANVKKWGLAPMTGTLAPPPAYGSERGSILLESGQGTPGNPETNLNVGSLQAAIARSQLGSSVGSSLRNSTPMSTPRSSNSSRRHRRAGKAANLAGSVPAVPSPLRASEAGPGPRTAGSRRRALGRAAGQELTYVSPTDTPQIAPRVPDEDALENLVSDEELDSPYESESSHSRHSRSSSTVQENNPPTPNLLDISLHSFRPGHSHYFGGRSREEEGDGSGSGESDETARPTRPTIGPRGSSHASDSPPPPGYAPIDPHMYGAGLPADLPEDMINQAIAAMSGEADPLQRPQTPSSPTPAPRQNSIGEWISSWTRGR